MFNVKKLITAHWYLSPVNKSLSTLTSAHLKPKSKVNCNLFGLHHANCSNLSRRPSSQSLSTSSIALSSVSLSSSLRKNESLSERPSYYNMNNNSKSREKIYQSIETALMVEKKVIMFRLQKFLDELKAASSIKSSESLLLIRCCGSYLLESTKDDRNKLVKEVWSLLESKSAPLDISHYNALLNVYIDNEYPVDPVEFLATLEERGIKPNRVTYHRLLHLYCQQGNLSGAHKILLKMKADDLPVHEGVFNSLIYGNMKAGSIESGENVLTIMKENQVDPTSETYVTLLKSYSLYMDKPEIEEKMVQILKILAKNEMALSYDQYGEVLEAIAEKNENHPLLDELLHTFPKNVGYNTALARLAIRAAYKQKINLGFKLIKKIADSMTMAKQEGYNNVGGFFIYHLVRAGVPFDEVSKACSVIESFGNEWAWWKATESALYNLEDTDLIKKYLKTFQQKTSLIRPHFIWPLICRMKTNQEMLELLKEEVLPYQANFGPLVISETFRTYVWPRITTNQSEFAAKCKKLGFDPKLIICTLVDSTQRNTSGLTLTDILNKRPLPRNITDGDVTRVLQNVVATVKDGLLAKEILQVILKEIDIPVTNRMFIPVYSAIIQNSDVTTALNEWLECMKLYGQIPCKSLMLQKLIEAEDTENLQKVTDICMERVGERETLINLVIAFLRSKKDKQAKKILTRPSFARYDLGLQRITAILSRQNETDSLERLITITKDIVGVDREKLYYTLLEAFIQTNAPHKALEMWTQMQEENFIPSPRIISQLARFLKENKLDVPFKYQDEIKEGEEIIKTQDARTLRDQFHNNLRANNLDRALIIKKQLEAHNSPLTLGEECTLIEKFIRNNRVDQALDLTKQVMATSRFPSPRIYKSLLEKMAHEGRFTEIAEMIESLPAALKETSWFSETVILALTHSKNPDINSLLRILPSLHPLPFTSVLEMLEIFPKFEKLIFQSLEELAAARGTNSPRNITWLRLMKTGRYDEAKSLFQSIPDFKDTLVFKSLLYDIKRNKNLALGKHLIDQLNQTDINVKSKASAYDALLYALLEKNLVKEAQDLLLRGIEVNNNKKSKLTLFDINFDILIRLSHAVKNNLGQNPKFDLPDKTITLRSSAQRHQQQQKPQHQQPEDLSSSSQIDEETNQATNKI